ncbi:MFS transporter [Burkholderia cenocepacia]|jgi:DHA2 family methylenomycin A resistance protein-like MFS transporter|uniref:Major Facilitator Superfamily protein n=1 Tax=Burkholderia cenocepacia (strain ATCC BAA-245 / DSM 16553 / LMG 16656 / NCTC 13227 / J2315 / CF5610) TaxID=216591 RepID=B4EGJ2_BURCJ|nr:MFS transporter [Burkholderia cenocepacia]CAR53924.1 Major Facilitator Superfamily protein [Burkholderia cenocepacia J2315]ONR62837.1 MFS transporter [Burkholderia cenocepacia]ONR80242.1 MFS transporter [Burkholderia cenocepacia]ONR88471.1 MFS transporter [Burkholderia cenocepacia]
MEEVPLSDNSLFTSVIEEADAQSREIVKSRALITVCIGFFMVSLDATVVNVALNSLRLSLHVGLSGLQWTVDSYTLAFAALLLSAGALGDIFGPKKVFNVGLIVFSLASALCGLSTSLGALLASRVLQGVGAALLVATSLSLLQKIFVEPADRARAFGVWGGVGGVAVAAGPVLGGFLISMFGWPSVFLVNVPFGILGVILSARYLPKMPGEARRINFGAQVLSAVALGALAFLFISAGAHGWSSRDVQIAAAAFAIATCLFLGIERFSANPMLPRGIFRSRIFSAATTVGMIINFGFYGQLFVLSLYFQQICKYSTMETGLALLPQAIVCSLTAFYCGRVTARTGPGFPMKVGLLAGALGLFGLTFANGNSSYVSVLIPMLAVGFGMSFTAPATVAAGMSAAPAGQAGIVSGVINAARQSGSVMGIAVLGGLIGLSSNFEYGMHLAFWVASVLFAGALLVTALRIRK